MTEPAKKFEQKMRPPTFGAEGSKASELKFTASTQFVFGIFDEVVIDPPAHKRYALVAEDITLTTLGALCTLKEAPSRPRQVLVPWVAIAFALPMGEAQAG